MKFLIKVIFKLQIWLSSLEAKVLRAIQIGDTAVHKVGGIAINWKLRLPPDAYIIEVGAYNGNDSAYFAQTFPTGKVISFEPDLILYGQLLKKSQIWPNISCFPYAVAEKTEICTFFSSDGGSRASGSIKMPTIHLELFPDVVFPEDKRQRVVSVSLDHFLLSETKMIDLIWIDAQGAELDVLKGAVTCLKRTSFVFCEVSSRPIYSEGANFVEVRDFLLSLNFKLIASDVEFESNEIVQHGNALFSKTHSY